MLEIIKSMVKRAEENRDFELLEDCKKLIYQFAITINCPSNWREIGEELASCIKENNWVYDELQLWDYVD